MLTQQMVHMSQRSSVVRAWDSGGRGVAVSLHLPLEWCCRKSSLFVVMGRLLQPVPAPGGATRGTDLCGCAREYYSWSGSTAHEELLALVLASHVMHT